MSYISEKEIIKSVSPIPINEEDLEEVSVLGEHGLWANKQEVENWNGSLPVEDYKINEDEHPDHIIKTIHKPAHYQQSVWVKYLKPPPPPPHGDLIIKQENDIIKQAPPPIILRQVPARPRTPDPVVLREKPPLEPTVIPQQVVTIPGKVIDTPPRKVIIERLPELPPKPAPIIIEKWLPYEPQRRKVVYEQANITGKNGPIKNVIIEWRLPNSCVDKQIKCLGIEIADPREYTNKYGSQLKESYEMPEYVKNLRDCNCYQKYLNENRSYILEGDVDSVHYLSYHAREKLGINRLESFENKEKNGLYSIVLRKSSISNDFGMTIRGGSDFGMGIYVLRLKCGGPASLDDYIQPGDEIMKINKNDVSNLSQAEVVTIFRQSNTVSLLIRRTGLPPPTVADVLEAMEMRHI